LTLRNTGLLVVIDGAKGLLAAATRMFEGVCLTQRCQWHKRENVVWYRPWGRTGRLAPAAEAYGRPA
jgi:hypothetical protein